MSDKKNNCLKISLYKIYNDFPLRKNFRRQSYFIRTIKDTK
jgi:hypothetical protein